MLWTSGGKFYEEPFECWRAYDYDDLLKRDNTGLDLFWLRDESLEDSANLPGPDVLALEVSSDLEVALEQFASIASELSASSAGEGDQSEG